MIGAVNTEKIIFKTIWGFFYPCRVEKAENKNYTKYTVFYAVYFLQAG